ncbi:MAG: hypothetical protein RI980_499 [Bacteroidota bacterium]|jgi:hypothetical protein
MATIKIGGKEVPLTKSGLPNRVYLSKEARAVVKEYAENKKKEKKEVLVKELTDILNKLG